MKYKYESIRNIGIKRMRRMRFRCTTYTISSSGGDGASIQAAINAAYPGDTIEVHSGIYYELVNVKKQLTLRGVDTGGGKPAVDARLRGSAITLTADGITLEGFAVTNWTGMGMMEFLWTVGIKITSNNNIITNNTVSNSSRGISINSSCNNIITNNTVSNSSQGITLCSWGPGNNSITGNTISNNKEGIGLWHSRSNNTFTGNIASNNTYADVNIELSNNNTLTGNNISSNYRSIDLYCSSNNKIYLNNFINNTDNVHY